MVAFTSKARNRTDLLRLIDVIRLVTGGDLRLVAGTGLLPRDLVLGAVDDNRVDLIDADEIVRARDRQLAGRRDRDGVLRAGDRDPFALAEKSERRLRGLDRNDCVLGAVPRLAG